MFHYTPSLSDSYGIENNASSQGTYEQKQGMHVEKIDANSLG